STAIFEGVAEVVTGSGERKRWERKAFLAKAVLSKWRKHCGDDLLKLQARPKTLGAYSAAPKPA
ncbi:MAG: hypothetical protein U0T84_00005, partial [Chitinophagales bacterium]